jgi:hypothetical protein
MQAKVRTGMTVHRSVLIALAFASSTALGGELIDGSAPLECRAEQGHDCLPGEAQCGRLKRDTNQPPVIAIDLAKGEIHSPFRTSVLRVGRSTSNKESLVLQGSDLLFAWSAVINKTTGALTISIADRQGAYIVFGKCTVAKTM